ncbi:unnamed protein product [Alopecurus aequalis]
MASIPEWSNLLPDLLGQVIRRLPSPGDRARFRAVCRSWHAAMRLHVSPSKQLPWVVFSDGTFSTPLDSGVIHRLPFFPKNTRCIGSTDDWLALDCTDEVARTHTYLLHNPFTGAIVPLPELGSLIGKVPGVFEIRKVLMRSTPDDLVAVTCNIWRCPLIMCRPGKLSSLPYFRIIDVAFIGDKLYAITKAEDLFALHIAEDGDGKPTITTVKRIIRHPPGHDDDKYNDEVWMGPTDIDASSGEDEEEELDEDDEEELDEDDEEEYDEEELDDEALDQQDNHDLRSQVDSADDVMLSDCDEGVNQRYGIILNCRHLVESHGKLFMVRRQWLCSAFTPTDHTRKVEVFEADVDAGTWVPVTNGLGGHAIFISRHFSRLVPACGEVEHDLIYFPDTNDVFDMRTGLVRTLGPMSRLDDYWRVWVFPPDLVV